MIVTKESLTSFIAHADEAKRKHIIGRACVALFRRQTESEKECNNTNNENGIGFTKADAHSGSITAKYYLKHQNLLGWQVESWMSQDKKGGMRIAKYWKQLNQAAEEKRNEHNCKS